MIDIHDCDARLPSSGDTNDLYMDELVRLSVLLGRVLKTIYRYVALYSLARFRSYERMIFPLSPSGLTTATDPMLHELLRDLEAWKDNLPENLKYRGPETPRNPGMVYPAISFSKHLAKK